MRSVGCLLGSGCSLVVGWLLTFSLFSLIAIISSTLFDAVVVSLVDR